MIERVFLDWQSAFLPQAAEWLVSRCKDGKACDMRGCVLVFPGQRALRRCIELLYEKTVGAGLSFIPPRMTSVGTLPELISEIPFDLASETQCVFAWMRVLKLTKASAMKVLAPHLPGASELNAWLMLAERLQAIYQEISASLLSFEDVAARIKQVGTFPDEARWELLAALYEKYQEQLESEGLLDRHILRRRAMQKEAFRLHGELILLSTAELNAVNKAMLAKLETPVISLVHAPSDRKADFDEYGCVISERWGETALVISDTQYQIVDKPVDLKDVLLEKISECSDPISSESLRIGICDSTLSPYVLQALDAKGIAAREAAGQKAKDLEIFIFLKITKEFLTLRHFYIFSSLLRLPAVEAWTRRYFEASGDLEFAELEYLSILDEYQTAHLQAQIGEQVFGEGRYPQIVKKLYAAIKVLLGDFLGPEKGLQEWSQSLMDLLLRLYGGDEEKRTEEEKECFLKEIDAVRIIAEECFSLSGRNDGISAAEALAFILHRLAYVDIPSETQAGSVELLGWLELRLDDADCVFVTGFNETSVPEVLNSDPFLPDALRHFLGLLDNDKRYARDAYTLSTMLHSKKKLFLIGTRQSASGDRLLPSRLLYTGDPQEIVGRVARIFCTDGNRDLKKTKTNAPRSARSFELPMQPQKMPRPLKSLSVSGFGDYLVCPYRFYLKHVLKLNTLDDSMLELDPLHFGTLAHEVLGDFGQSALKDSSNAKEIETYLCDLLSDKSSRNFGAKVLPAVLMQVEQLRERLRCFAKWQAERRSQGWEIMKTELGFKEDDFVLSASGSVLRVTGRIDRLDYHSKEDRYMVLDYKVSEAKSSPEKAHRKQKKWVNLQLPMYLYYLSKVHSINAPLSAGFISLCASLKDIGIEEASWSGEDLSEAFKCMRWVAEKVLMQEFWPPSDLSAARDNFALLFGAFGKERN